MRPRTGERAIESLASARRAFEACAEKKAYDLRLLDVSGLTIVADYFVICTAGSDVNARAIADEVRRALKEHERTPIGVEGREDGWWVLIDYGDIVVHVFREEARQYYAIEQTWSDARVIETSEAA